MRDEKDGRAEAPLDRLEVFLRLGADHRVKRAERFVHQEDVRSGGKGPRHADALLLPAGKFVRIAVAIGARLKLEQLQQFIHARLNALFRPAEECGNGRDIFADRSMWKKPVLLDHIADPPP